VCFSLDRPTTLQACSAAARLSGLPPLSSARRSRCSIRHRSLLFRPTLTDSCFASTDRPCFAAASRYLLASTPTSSLLSFALLARSRSLGNAASHLLQAHLRTHLPGHSDSAPQTLLIFSSTLSYPLRPRTELRVDSEAGVRSMQGPNTFAFDACQSSGCLQ